MGKPIVLYEDIGEYTSYEEGAVFRAQSVAGFPAVNSFSPFTYPSDSFMIERGEVATEEYTGPRILFTPTASFDSICIVISGVEEGETIVVSLQDDSSTVIHDFDITQDGVYWFKFASITPTGFYYILAFAGFNEASSDSVHVSIPVIKIGKAMEFEKCIMKSYAPLDYNRATEYLTNESGTGQFMGRSIVRRNHESSVSFDLMSAAWVRSTFQPFVRHARTKPYFFAWNYDDYPAEVNYVWTDEDIGVSYTGDRDKMTASWKMRGLGNDQE